MAEDEGATPERPVFAKAKGTFHVTSVSGRMLQNGNKLHVVIEAEYDAQLSADMGPLFDKDCAVSFKELATQPHRKKYGGGEGQLLTTGGVEGEEDEIPAE